MSQMEPPTSSHSPVRGNTVLVSDELLTLLPTNWPRHIPLARITTCGRLTIEVVHRITSNSETDGHFEVVYGPPDAKLLAEKGTAKAFILLALLASQPGCFATKDFLSEKLGRQHEEEDEESDTEGLKRVDNVVSRLRRLLYPPMLDDLPGAKLLRRGLVTFNSATTESGPGYRLCGTPLIWLDVEVIRDYVKRARALEQFGRDGGAEWQRCYDLSSQGPFLSEEPYSDWASWRRQEVEKHWWDSVQVLWRRSVQQGEAGEAEALRLLRDYWLAHITNEDALRPLLELLCKQECFGQAQQYYDQLSRTLTAEGKQPDRRTIETMEFVRVAQIQRPAQPVLDFSSKGSLAPHERSSLFSQVDTQDTIEVSVSKREVPNGARGLPATDSDSSPTTTTLLTPSHGQLFLLWERLLRVLTKSSSIDETTLQLLEMHTEQYWQARQRAAAASCDLLSYVWDHLQKVTLLLEGSLLPTIRMRLCSIACKTAQLVGELLLDMGHYEQGKQFHEASITAAQEACNQSLEAIAWGRTSLAWIYCDRTQDAWVCIQEARRLIAETDTPISSWLAAIEAEVEARRFDSVACLRALKEAEKIEGQRSSFEDRYLTHFDGSLLRGYQGVCFRRLYRSDDPQSITFLNEAQRVLKEALASLDPILIQRQPTFLTDLADTYIQQGEIEEACQRAIQAVSMATQIKLQKVVLRLLKIRQELEPWKDTQYVKTLDSYLVPLQTTKAKY